MLQEKVADIVSRLKKVREENGLSYQRISDLVEQNGGHVSLSTIRRVFEPGSESYGWQYEYTLRPIADAVLGVYAPSEVADDEDTAEALRAALRYKNERLAELEAQLSRVEESYRRRLEFVKNQVALKDARIDRRDAMIERLVDVVLKRPNCPHCSKCGGDVRVRSAKSKAR